MDKKKIAELSELVGPDRVFSRPEFTSTYSYDATGMEYPPDVVVLPYNEDDIKKTLVFASREKIPVTPRGAGVGYSGGALPVQGGISLALTRMNRIIQIDSKNYMAVVEPGVITYDLQEAARGKGLFYPPDPASLKTSTIGGNVAENAGGMRCFKYGVTGNYVLKLDAYLISGEKIRAGSPVIKDVAGYDLKSLLVGSEGTLAVVSKIWLKLIPRPESQLLFRVDFASLEMGAAFINTVINSRIGPSALEFMDESSLSAVSEYTGEQLMDGVSASVLIEVDGAASLVRENREKVTRLIGDSGAANFRVAESAAEQEELWKLRRNISPAIARIRPTKINEDIVVPPGRIPETVKFIKRLAAEMDLVIVLFGHFGDGNIHTNLMVDPANQDEMERAGKTLSEIFKYVISVNGSISGEHGIGISKKAFMSYQFNQLEMSIFRGIKTQFDPAHLLNPGKLF